VQRASAILLLVLFSFSLIGTVALAGPDPKIPECCRREGKHHCSTMTGSTTTQDSSGAGVKSVGEKCPYSPARGASLAYGKAPLHRAVRTIDASLVSHPAGLVQTDARYRASFSRVRQKRGPPFLS